MWGEGDSICDSIIKSRIDHKEGNGSWSVYLSEPRGGGGNDLSCGARVIPYAILSSSQELIIKGETGHGAFICPSPDKKGWTPCTVFPRGSCLMLASGDPCVCLSTWQARCLHHVLRRHGAPFWGHPHRQWPGLLNGQDGSWAMARNEGLPIIADS